VIELVLTANDCDLFNAAVRPKAHAQRKVREIAAS
jgi:hypothetical protein